MFIYNWSSHWILPNTVSKTDWEKHCGRTFVLILSRVSWKKQNEGWFHPEDIRKCNNATTRCNPNPFFVNNVIKMSLYLKKKQLLQPPVCLCHSSAYRITQSPSIINNFCMFAKRIQSFFAIGYRLNNMQHMLTRGEIFI